MEFGPASLITLTTDFQTSRKTIIERDEFYIEELVEMEREFEDLGRYIKLLDFSFKIFEGLIWTLYQDELFFECDEADLDAFYRNRRQKVEKIKTVGKILNHMDKEEQTFSVSSNVSTFHFDLVSNGQVLVKSRSFYFRQNVLSSYSRTT